MKGYVWIKVDPAKCELEGPFECPYCAGHVMVDCTFIDQVDDFLCCPYCRREVEVPE